MKKIHLMLLCLYSTQAFSQIKNIPATKDSSVVIDNLYAGVLSWNETRLDSFSVTARITVRIGAMSTARLAKDLSLNVFGVYETNGVTTPTVLAQYSLKYQPLKRWKILVGNMATPATEQRPLPPTSNGQFETWTMSQIPGLVPGIKTSYDFKNKITGAIGYALRKGFPEYHVAVGSKSLVTAIYYQSENDVIGFVNTIKTKKIYSLLVYQHCKRIANTFVYSFGRSISLYNDYGYNISTNNLERLETGLFKSFDARIVSGLVSISFNAKTNSINTYLFVHL